MTTTKLAEAFPLSWPVGYPRTKNPKRSVFRTTIATATAQIQAELQRLGADPTSLVVSTNMPIRKDGMPYSDGRIVGGDQGVAVYFRIGQKPFTLASDKWDRLADNLHAIALSIEAMRSLDRWGVSQMLERVFQGFQALPAPGQTLPTAAHGQTTAWWLVLGVAEDAPLPTCESAYRNSAARANPAAALSDGDRLAREARIRSLNLAVEEARKIKRGVS